MSFRRRITLVSAAAVAIAVVLASLLTYLLTSHQLRGQVDTQLSNRADSLRFVARSPVRRSPGSLLDLIKGQDSEQAPQAGLSTQSSPQGSPLRNVPPRPNQVRGYQQLDRRARPRAVPLGQRHAPRRRPHPRAGGRRGRRASSATPASTASACASSPSTWLRCARFRWPSR